MKITRAALAAALAVGGSAALLHTGPAGGQLIGEKEKQRQNRRAQPQISNVSRDESAAIMPLYQAVQTSDWAAANAALAAAQAGARSPYSRYLVAQLHLAIGRGTESAQVQAQAVDAMIASGGAPADALPQLLGAQAGFALQANNAAAAEAPLTRLVELDPNNVARIRQLAQVKNHLNKRPEALVLYRRALQLSEANGQRAPEDLHRATLAVAYEGRMLQPALELSRTMVTAYPTAENWRAALAIYHELGGPEAGVELDLRRLMRAAGALGSERDYFEYAEAANRGGLPGEAKTVLEEGLSRNMFTTAASSARSLLSLVSGRIAEDRASLPGLRTRALAASGGRDARVTGDVYYSYGQYADAATLYRAALQKGGEDSNLVNTRLGAALALAGQRAEAEAAFRAITGPRAELAQFWLLWVSTRP